MSSEPTFAQLTPLSYTLVSPMLLLDNGCTEKAIFGKDWTIKYIVIILLCCAGMQQESIRCSPYGIYTFLEFET